MQHAAALKAAPGLKGAGPFFATPLSATTAYVLVVRVDYSDRNMTKTLAQTQAFFDSMKTFYRENSYGLMTVSATVTNNVYRSTSTLAATGQGLCSFYSNIAHDALAAAAVDYNISQATAAGGRPFTHLMVYHAGFGAETSGDSGCATDNIWSVYAPTVPVGSDPRNGVIQPLTANGVFFNGVTVVPELENFSVDPLGVICHEYGHQLGLPDLYNTPSLSAVGKWSLMDAGIYIGSPQGSNPAHLDAWSKQFLGFSQPQTITAATAQSKTLLNAATDKTSFLRIPVDVSPVGANNEYFLLEYRRASGTSYDTALPTRGLLIWHVDDSVAMNTSRLDNNNINNGSPNRGLDLVEADGSDPSSNTGDSGDPWQDGSTFALPKSNAFNNSASGIVVSNVSGVASNSPSITMNVTKLAAAGSVDIAKTLSAPNPAGSGYPAMGRASAGTLTTLIFQLTRPYQTAKLTIHDLSGSLVKNVPSSEISLQAGPNLPSADFKWVYEYNWDGKNDGGESVASGVYLYRFKADENVIKTGKIAVVR
jgi:M6 family metalloprotease-like protein